MKDIRYISIAIQGFGSIESPQTFVLDRQGSVTLIKGNNGVGKTTIFNALLWCEYGITVKKSIATWPEQRTANFQGTRVVVIRTDGETDYMIARHQDFKATTKGLKGGDKLMIFTRPTGSGEWELKGDGLHKADMQAEIIDQLGMSDTAYMKSVWFGQRMQSLVDSKNEDKRELFEALFDVDFEAEKLLAKEMKDEADRKAADLTDVIDDLSADIEGYEEDLKALHEQAQVFEGQKNADIIEEQVKMASWDDSVKVFSAQLEAKKKELEKFDSDKEEKLKKTADASKKAVSDFEDKLSDAKMNVSDCLRELKKAEGNLSRISMELANVKENCLSCGSPLDKKQVAEVKKNLKNQQKAEESVIKTLTSKKDEAEAVVTSMDEEIGFLNAQKIKDAKALEDFRASSIDVNALNVDIAKLETNIENAKKSKAVHAANIDKIKARVMDFDDTKLKTKIQEAKDGIASAEKDLPVQQERARTYGWWVTKGFSASGIKAFVFNSMLGALNESIRNYAHRLGVRVEFSVDLTKASKPFKTLIYKGDNVRDYADLSGGQKQRIDVCVAFAMYDLVCGSSNVNILLMDELFEGLDTEGIETAFDMIRGKAEQGKSVYVITHSDIIDSFNCRSVWVEADELGNTKILK